MHIPIIFILPTNDCLQTYHMQSMRRSRLKTENFFYLKYSPDGVTAKVSPQDDLSDAACYREVHYIEKQGDEYRGDKLFADEYQIDLGVQFGDDDTVIVKRLSNLYPAKLPKFFDISSQPSRPEGYTNGLHCLNELALFPTTHYRSLFITQDFSKTGQYILVTNNDGRFEVITVDDRIPINKDTLEPIWGMSYKNPWELILLKAWAKKRGGYHRIFQANPFEFIESFSNPTWKYFNLTKSPELFIHKYTTFSKSKHAKIVLKTKDESSVKAHGFLRNSASYEIVKGFTHVNNNKEEAYLAIRGTSKNSWPGSFGFLDKNAVQAFQKINPQISLERCFIISGEDLLNNFSAAYLTSVRQENYFTGYRILEIQANERKALHFEFYVPSEGFFDFCIKQFPENSIQASKINASTLGQGVRYLKNKYMLVRDNASDSNRESDFLNSDKHNPQPVQQSVINSNIYASNANQYRSPRFTVYEIEYLKGYNKGEAHFLHLTKGRYILRLKSENVKKPAKYSINWVSSSKTEIEQANLTKQEKVDLLHDSIVSFMHKTQNYSLEKGKKTEMISYGNTFEDIGYGFVAVKSTINCPNNILLRVDPAVLKQQGYILKGKYKDDKDPFNIEIKKGEYYSVVLKLDNTAKQHIWPTQAFEVFKREERASESNIKNSRPNSNINNTQNIAMTESRIINPPEVEKPNEHDEYAPEAAQH